MAKKETKLTAKCYPVKEVYIHKYFGKVQSVDVAVLIEYKEGKISLVDTQEINFPRNQGFTSKKYIFAGRELEYMEGWRDILDGIRSAIEDAEGRLKVYQKERELEEEIELHRVAQMIASQK